MIKALLMGSFSQPKVRQEESHFNALLTVKAQWNYADVNVSSCRSVTPLRLGETTLNVLEFCNHE